MALRLLNVLLGILCSFLVIPILIFDGVDYILRGESQFNLSGRIMEYFNAL